MVYTRVVRANYRTTMLQSAGGAHGAAATWHSRATGQPLVDSLMTCRHLDRFR